MGVNTKVSGGAGCLVLFALPFAAVGVGALGMFAWTVASCVSMQSWREAPARMDRVELVADDSGDSTTYRVEAEYTYEWEGREYRGDRVSVHSGSDNVGSFHHRAAAELEEHRDSGLPFPCFVNPDDPSQAVLYRNPRIEMLGAMLLFGLVFAGAGFGILGAAVFGARATRETAALREQHPDAPWRWKREWDTGVLSAHSKGKMIGAFAFAALWNLVSSPVLFFVPDEVRGGNTLALIGLLFPLVGLGAIVAAVYLALQWRRYGNTVFEMDAVPGVVGGMLSGRVRIPTVVLPEKDAVAVLECVRRRTTGSGENRRTSVDTLWQEELSVPRGALAQESRATLVPVRFLIPPDQPPTDEEDSDNQLLWRLRARMAVPGVDFSALFEVPVFRTADSPAPGAAAAADDGAAVMALDEAGNAIPDPAAPDPAKTGETLRRAGVLTEPAPGGGMALAFPMLRQPGAALGTLAITAVWGGVVALLLKSDAPAFFPAVFGLFLLILAWASLDLCFGRSRVEVNRDGLRARGGLFGLGREHRLAFGDIAGLDIQKGMQAGNTLYYSVAVLKHGGGKVRVADRLRQDAARAVVAALETALRDYGGGAA